MHIPDGFIDAQTSLAPGRWRSAALGSACGAPPRRSRTGRRRWPGWSRRSSSPCRCSTSRCRRHLRPPARRHPGRDPRRAVGRGALRVRGPPRPVPAVRRRRPDRARAEHHQHGDHRHVRRLAVFVVARRVLPTSPAWWWSPPGSPPHLGGAGRAPPSCSSTRSAAPRRPVATVVAAMVGVHVLIGIGEGLITALTVAVVLGVRPDLVYGAQRPRPADPGIAPGAAEVSMTSVRLALFLIARAPCPRGLALVFSSFAPAARTAWRRSPPTRASSETAHATCRTPAGRLRGQGRRRRAAQHGRGGADRRAGHVRGRPGCSLLPAYGGLRRAPGAGTGERRATGRADRWGAGHATPLPRRDEPVHRPGPSASWRRPCCSCSPWWPRRASSSGPSASTPGCWPSWPLWPGCLGALARRLSSSCRSCCSRCSCRSSATATGRRARPVAVGRGALGGVEHPGQGHAGRGDLARAGRDHDRARPPRGLERLRVPRLHPIAAFMVRYGRRDRRRGAAHAHRPPVPRPRPPLVWQARAVAAAAGALFVRSFERGERVHLAMVSRGYAGRCPCSATRPRPRPVAGRLARAGRGRVVAAHRLAGSP